MHRFLSVTALLMGAISATAAPIGTLNIAGLGIVRISATDIDFSPLGGSIGSALVTGTSGGFMLLPLGSTVEITDLDALVTPPGPPLGVPLDPFLFTPSIGALFSFALGQMPLGGGVSCVPAPAVGSSCTPSELVPNSPFLLTQNATGVTASFSVRGTVTDLSDNSTAGYTGLFSANFTQDSQNTVAEVLAAFGPGGPGFIDSAWSAQFTADLPVPETESGMLTLIGLIGVGIGFLRRKQV